MLPAARMAQLRAAAGAARGGPAPAPLQAVLLSTGAPAEPPAGGADGSQGGGGPAQAEGPAAPRTAATTSAAAPPRRHPLLQAILRSDLAAEVPEGQGKRCACRCTQALAWRALAAAAATPPRLLPTRQQEAAAALYRGQQRVLGRRPDLAAFQAREEAHAAALRQLAPAHRTRPSLLAPALRAAAYALGVVSAAAPRPLAAAVAAGVQDALTDACNEQLRRLREAGLADGAPQVCPFPAVLLGAGRVAAAGAPCACAHACNPLPSHAAAGGGAGDAR